MIYIFMQSFIIIILTLWLKADVWNGECQMLLILQICSQIWQTILGLGHFLSFQSQMYWKRGSKTLIDTFGLVYMPGFFRICPWYWLCGKLKLRNQMVLIEIQVSRMFHCFTRKPVLLGNHKIRAACSRTHKKDT